MNTAAGVTPYTLWKTDPSGGLPYGMYHATYTDRRSLSVIVTAGETTPERSVGASIHWPEYANVGDCSYYASSPVACRSRICVSPRR